MTYRSPVQAKPVDSIRLPKLLVFANQGGGRNDSEYKGRAGERARWRLVKTGKPRNPLPTRSIRDLFAGRSNAWAWNGCELPRCHSVPSGASERPFVIRRFRSDLRAALRGRVRSRVQPTSRAKPAPRAAETAEPELLERDEKMRGKRRKAALSALRNRRRSVRFGKAFRTAMRAARRASVQRAAKSRHRRKRR